MSLETWMSKYQDRRLCDLHMPAAHDAGTAKGHINKTLLGTNSNSATQSMPIIDQIKIGTRFFDLRLKKIKTGWRRRSKVVAHHTTLGQGAHGTKSFDEILSQAADWWQTHKTEVLIFRISHTDPDTHVHEIITESGKGALHQGTGNLCTKTLRDITLNGGGIICIVDEKKFGNHIKQDAGVHSFSKYSGAPNKAGIACCGTYKRTHTLNKVVTTGLRAQYEHNERHAAGDHLWQLYWQKTYTNPFSTTGIETGTKRRGFFRPSDGKVHGGTHAATSHMIKLMQGHDRFGSNKAGVTSQIKDDYTIIEGSKADPETNFPGRPKVMMSTLPVRNYMLPNIISYDFVDGTVNQQIVELNSKMVQQIEDDDDE